MGKYVIARRIAGAASMLLTWLVEARAEDLSHKFDQLGTELKICPTKR
jgi:hypothetical protein